MVGQFMTNWFWSSILEENDDNNLKDKALTLNAFFTVKFCISETWTEFGWNKKNLLQNIPRFSSPFVKQSKLLRYF